MFVDFTNPACWTLNLFSGDSVAFDAPTVFVRGTMADASATNLAIQLILSVAGIAALGGVLPTRARITCKASSAAALGEVFPSITLDTATGGSGGDNGPSVGDGFNGQIITEDILLGYSFGMTAPITGAIVQISAYTLTASPLTLDVISVEFNIGDPAPTPAFFQDFTGTDETP